MTTHGTSSRDGGSPLAHPREKLRPLGAGHRLDEFELLEVIGEGGFGIVYRAYDHSLQREVAIKEYMPSMLARRVGNHSVHVRSEQLTATFQAGLHSFINEARTLAQFSHAALVRVHRFWEAHSTAYMAIQLYQGRTLRQLAEDEPSKLTEPWLLDMLGPLLGALETLHRSQCFHRDIAPDNIFIQQDGVPVLLDFGAARKSIADLADEVAIMVKSGYSPIEQYADDSALQQGAWTDLYALGAVLYRAITGHPPPSAVVRSVQDTHVPLASMGRADLSPAFCAAIDHTLAVHSADRTQTVAAFAAELGLVKLGDMYARGIGVPATTIPAVSTPQEPRKIAAPSVSSMRSGKQAASSARQPSSMPSWQLVGLLLIALAVVGGWLGQRWSVSKQDSSAAAVQVPPPLPPPREPASPHRAVASPAPAPPPVAMASPPPPTEPARPPRVVNEIAAARTHWPKPARCAEIVQKSSLDSLDAEEIAYLKKACR